jgi:hypothetical protein
VKAKTEVRLGKEMEGDEPVYRHKERSMKGGRCD